MKGHIIEGHEHNFDHTTICFYGALTIRAKPPGEPERIIQIEAPRPGYDGPSHALIEAGVRHELIPLVEGTIFWCVYSHRDAQGAVVQEYEGDGSDSAYGTWTIPTDEYPSA